MKRGKESWRQGNGNGPTTLMHLTASPCHGGPERQMLGLAQELSAGYKSIFASFLEEGRCWDFIRQAQSQGFQAHALRFDTPRVLAALQELVGLLRDQKVSILFCHGYKAGILGRIAARRVGIPVVAVSRGWTGESLRVRIFEFLDRLNLRWMDRVVCVSKGQAEKVRCAGMREGKITVIHNAIRPERFADPDPAYRELLCRMFPEPPDLVVGAAGRLSPEKGFDILVAAAAQVLAAPRSVFGTRDAAASPLARSGREVGGEGGNSPCSPLLAPCSVGFVLFGDGPLRDSSARQIAACGLEGKFILAGFRPDLDQFLPHLDLFVQSSLTEGLPNVILESQAAGVPVVATSVGGTPEVIEDGLTGYLVEPRNAHALAKRIADMLADPARRREMGAHGRDKVRQLFSFAQQGREYLHLLGSLLPSRGTLIRQGQPALAETGPEE